MFQHSEKEAIKRVLDVIDALLNGTRATRYNLYVSRKQIMGICRKYVICREQTKLISLAFDDCMRDLQATDKFTRSLIVLEGQIKLLDKNWPRWKSEERGSERKILILGTGDECRVIFFTGGYPSSKAWRLGGFMQ